jgi:hypothetical protein
MTVRRTPAIALASVLTAAAVFGSGWVGQGRVNHPNGDTVDQQPVIGLDRTGKPWVVWHTNSTDTSLFYSTWNGTGWEWSRAVSANDSGVWGRLRPDLAFDEQDRAWLVWDNGCWNNSSVIAGCYWDDSQWSAEQQVSPANSTDLCFAPKVGCGGGQVWCVWYSGPTDTTAYSVYASRWDSVAERWQPEMRVSPTNGNNNWWCDVAVDTQGKPHVVWTETEHLAIYYSFYDGTQWSPPLLVNDSSRVKASAWPQPRIVIDSDGILHVSYTGVLNGAPARDVFYTRSDGSGWIPSVRVTQDTVHNYNEWYSDIAASASDNVWIAFMRQGEGSDQFRIYAVHFDGHSWAAEQRLDNDMASQDGGCSLILDSNDLPWVVWQGMDSASGNADIYFNRYASAGVAEKTSETPPVAAPVWANMRRRGCAVRYELSQPAFVRLDVYDLTGRLVRNLVKSEQKAGRHAAIWYGTDSQGLAASPGVYICRLQNGESIKAVKLILARQ